jgi:hypothetical protein
MTTPQSIKAIYEYTDSTFSTTASSRTSSPKPTVSQTLTAPIPSSTSSENTESPNPYLNALYTKLGEIKTSINDYLTSEIQRTGGVVNDEEEKPVGMEGVVEDDDEDDE